MTENARTRADVNVRSGPQDSARVLDRFPTDCPLEILEEANDWFKVKPLILRHSIIGYLPRAALIFPEPGRPAVFPPVLSAAGADWGPAVSASLLLTDFLKWHSAVGQPGWLPQHIWAELSAEQQSGLAQAILASVQDNQARWDDWLAALTANNRLADATMAEWIAPLTGGCEMYAIRDHYIYKKPLQDANYFGCALKGQIMRWTGNVCCDQETKRHTFYEVQFYRMGQKMSGWFRADLAAEYVYPSPENDPNIEANAAKVFDLSNPVLRHPQDEEIAAAKAQGYVGDQYIDVFNATQKHVRHFSLCGEFCVAALAGLNVIPMLKSWVISRFPRINAILGNPHEGTSAYDLKSLLDVLGMQSEIYSSMPTTPQHIRERLAQGHFAIVGCGISSGGKIKADGTIRHWVIMEQVLPVGSSGWVRVYNPFHNREEVYNYNLFVTSSGVGAGLWIEPCAP